MEQSIATKCTRLNEILNENGQTDKSWLISRQALLDGFLVLFDECGNEYMKKDKHIAAFIKKYEGNVKKLKENRPTIGDFKVISTIGRGHFGQVQVVKEIGSSDVFALKTLKKSEMLSQENVAFFEEERDIMAYGRSKWITSLHYAFQDMENLYLVMEFHPGGDLLTLLGKQENEVLDERMAKFYLTEIILAIHSLHGIGYVHRDVKPDNILIDKHGHIKLADFGSAAKLGKNNKVYSKMAVGTPEYISPEVLTSMEGSGGGYGVECDWWSLGIIAYEMIYGNPPFTGDSVAVTYSKIMAYKESLMFPTEIQGSLSFKNLIQNLLTDIDKRYGYNDLITHKFFTGINWSGIEHETPPYIPTITGVDDTSNFDEFEDEEDNKTFGKTPNLKKKGFCGDNLPFVGFTFLKKDKNEGVKKTIENGHVMNGESNNGLSQEEKESLQKMVVELQELLKKRKDAIENLENEKDLLVKEKILKETEIKDLQKRLDVERTGRNKDDNKAISLLAEVNTMRSKVHDLRKDETRSVLDQQQDVLTQLEEDRFIAMKRTQRLEEELEKQRKIADEKNVVVEELEQKVDELNKKLELAQKHETSTVEMFSCVAYGQYSSALPCQIRQIQRRERRQSSPLNSSAVCSQRVEEISNKILEAIEKTRENERSDLKKMRERLKKKMDECSELESQLCESNGVKRKLQKTEEKMKDVEKENEALCHAIKKLEKEIDDSKVTSDRVQRCLGEQQRKSEKSEKEVLKLKEELLSIRTQSEATTVSNKELEKQLSELRESCSTLENAEQMLKEELQGKTKHIEKLEWTAKYTSSKQSLEGTNEAHYKSQLDVKNNKLKELESKNKLLQESLDDLKTMNIDNNNRRKELEQELSDKKILVENLTREKQVQVIENVDDKDMKEVKRLESEITVLRNESEEVTKENKELNEQLEQLMEKCEQLMKTKCDLEEQLSSVRTKSDVVEKQTKEEILKESVRKDSVEVQDLKAEIVVINNENKELKTKSKEMQSNMRNLTEEMTNLKNTRASFEAEMEGKIKNTENLEKTVSMLKTTCSMLEGQIEELEIMNDELDEKNIQLDIEKKQLVLENEKYEQTRLQQLENERDNNDDDENKDKEFLKEYLEMIPEQKNQLNISELNLKSLERKMEKEATTKKKLLTEIEDHKSSLGNLEVQKSELERTFSELKERYEELLSDNQSMSGHLEALKSMHAEEKIKLVSTSAQQSKLIDFLQSKAESKASKKKRLGVTNLLNSLKHHAGEQHHDNNFIPCQWSELQQAFEKEKTTRVHLEHELNKVKQELEDSKVAIRKSRHMTPRSNQSLAVLSALQQSPSQQPSPGVTSTPTNDRKHKTSHVGTASHRPKERMRHNIPHRLTVMLNMRATKCPVCLDSILFGQQATKCTECAVMCHHKCSLSLQHTCGLPSQYVEHFSEAFLGPKSEMSLLSSTMMDEVSEVQGWLKIPRNGSVKNGWESKWVILEDEKLIICDQQKSNGDVVAIIGEDVNTKIHSAVAGSDLDGVAATDLPYVFCVETTPKTTCWPGRTIYILAPSFPDKQKWVRALERLTNEKKQIAQQTQQQINGNLLLKMTGEDCLDINCTAVLNDKFVLIGAEEGLFILSVTKPEKAKIIRQIPGVKNIFQISLVRDLGIVIMISGNDRDLLSVDLKQLEACTKQSCEVPLTNLEWKNIENITNCHLFSMKKVEEGFFLCAALSNTISVLRYNTSMNSFVLRKEIDSREPCSCISFTKSKIIVGSNKFYEVDLRQFTIKDFVDSKDASLSFVVHEAIQASSFPIDVLQITQENSKNEEFLLCFNGFGVFVNSNGRRTRKENLKWTSLPLSFAFREPYLFVTHFHSVEIVSLSTSSTNESGQVMCRKLVDITRPRILGSAMSSAAIYLVSTLSEEIHMLCYQPNLNATQTTTQTLVVVDQNSSSDSETTCLKSGRKRLHCSALGSENKRPSSFTENSSDTNLLSAFSRNPKKFLRSSLRY